MLKRSVLKISTFLLLVLSVAFVFVACGKMEFKVDFIVDDAVYATINTNGEEVLKMPNDPEKEGYVFDGWYWDDVLKNPVEDNTFTDKKGALKVYAKWIKQIDLSDFEKENMIEIIPADNKVTLENFANTEGPQDIFAYVMGKYEVTQELYMAVTGTNPSIDKGEKLPVNRVTWYDAVYFCNELTKVTMGEEECCY